MIVDIEKIIVKNRIRKDFGNIQELAEDIKENGLINPPVVNKEYCLLAGERRLRACKTLGWKQIEVRMMDTRDAEHELNVEISENENRKEFSKAERVDYMKRLLLIEQAKAKERQGEKTSVRNQTEVIRADDATAEQFGIGRDTLRKEIEIVDNKSLLTPEDFADWDEGKLSTNKAYQKIKAELSEKEERIAKLESEKDKPSMKDKFYQGRIKSLSDSNDTLKLKIVELERNEYELKQQIENAPVKEVVPDDYDDLKEQLEIAQFMNEKLKAQIDANDPLEEAKRELAAFKAKYQGLDELSELFDVIDEVFGGDV